MTLKEILLQFDRFDKKDFDESSVRAELVKLNEENGNKVDFELSSELMAFAFQENGSEEDYFVSMMTVANEDGTPVEYPSVEKVTPEMIQYWSVRVKQSNNPVMIARYSGLVWEFQKQVLKTPPPYELCKTNIKAILDLVNGEFLKRRSYHLRKLKRALDLSLSINDVDLIRLCKEAIIITEPKYAEDSKPGLWGYCFDLLVDNKKITLTPEEENAIIQDLEDRLARVTRESKDQRIDPWASEAASRRLAAYYKKHKKNEDAKRVILMTGKAFQETPGSAMQISGWLEHVQRLYTKHGLNTEAQEILVKIRKIGPQMASELSTISESIEISSEEVKKYHDEMLDGSIKEVLSRLVTAFIPRLDDTKEQIFKFSKESPILFATGIDLQDEKGRVIAKIGSLKDDLEGRIVHQVSENLTYGSIFLRQLIREAVVKKKLSKEDILEFVLKSPIFHPDRHPVLDKGVDAYFKGDFLQAIHLLIPQIEEAIRNLVEILGGVVIKVPRGGNGGYQLRTFDDLLRDPLIEKVFGEDLATYFRILFTDQRGWNLRNNVCHGIVNPSSFNAETADRLIHSLLCLGLMRKNG